MPAEPRWYHERWALLMLLLLLPPAGLLAAATVPGVSAWKKLGGGLLLVFAVAVVAAEEQDDAYLTRFVLDLTATIQYQKATVRFVGGSLESQADALKRAFALEPPPKQPNLLNQRPSSSDSEYRLGRLYDQAGRTHDARLYYGAASVSKDGSSYGEAQVGLAGVELGMGLVERAASRLNAVLDEHKIPPDNPDLILLRGRLLEHDNPSEARATLLDLVWKRRLAHLAEAHTELAAIAGAERRPADEMLHRLCAIRVNTGDHATLDRALETAKRQGLPLAPVRAFQRACFLQIDNHAGAVAKKVYGRILKLHPSFPGIAIIYLHLGYFRESTEHDPAGAIAYYKLAVQSSRQAWMLAESHYKLGRVYAASGLIKGARDCFRKSMQESMPDGYYLVASRRGLDRLSQSDETRAKMDRVEAWVDRIVAPDEED